MPGTYSRILLHFVFATKGRAPTIGSVWRDRMYQYMGGIAREERAMLIAAGGTPDHVRRFTTSPARSQTGRRSSRTRTRTTGRAIA